LVGHDLSMCILYRFHGWLIFARVIALFMFVWPYVHPHILCTQLVICLLSHFIHIWYLGWPWSEHVHIIPIARMGDFARVIALFMFVWPYVRSHILCTQLVICLLSHFIHIWYLDWPWSEHMHIIPISRTVDFCESDSPFHVCLTIRPSAHLVYGTSLLSHFMHIGHHDLNMRILYRLHGWLVFARVIALFMFVWPYVRSHILCTQLVFCRILLYPRSPKGEGGILFYLCPSVRPSVHPRYFSSHFSQ
jgi:hypothetical protein